MSATRVSRTLEGDAAHRMVAAAVAKGRERGCSVNAAVVDAGGQLLAFLREPGAPLHSIDIAIDKAYTAASFRCATPELYAAVAEPPALRDGILARPRLVAFGGGLPIDADGHHVGGVGISGGSEADDVACAEAALAALRG
ncbi:MAG: heme-binding protein [Myxococcota bacterium]